MLVTLKLELVAQRLRSRGRAANLIPGSGTFVDHSLKWLYILLIPSPDNTNGCAEARWTSKPSQTNVVRGIR